MAAATGWFMHDFARQMREIGRKQSRIMRESAMKRKEEYLGARVPKELREKVIAKADSLGIPVSILIRNILEEAFKNQTLGETSQTKPAAGASNRHDMKYPDVIGWEKITLNRDMSCSACSRVLPAGNVATIGLGISRESHVLLCEKCRVYV